VPYADVFSGVPGAGPARNMWSRGAA